MLCFGLRTGDRAESAIECLQVFSNKTATSLKRPVLVFYASHVVQVSVPVRVGL